LFIELKILDLAAQEAYVPLVITMESAMMAEQVMGCANVTTDFREGIVQPVCPITHMDLNVTKVSFDIMFMK